MEARHGPGVATVGDLIRTVAGLFSLGAAVIHTVVAGAHFREFWLFGAFFVVVAVLQAAWAAMILIRPSRALLVGGAVLNAAVVVVWGVSRVTGVPIGPEAGTPEAVGAIDLVATLEEVGAVAAILVLLAVPRSLRRPLRDGVPVPVIGGLAALVAGITAAAITAWRQGASPTGPSRSGGGHGVHLLLVAGAFVLFVVRALFTYRRSRTPPPRSADISERDRTA